MKKILEFICIALISLGVAFIYNSYFLSLATYPTLEKIILLVFLFCPLTYILSYLWFNRHEYKVSKPIQIKFPEINVQENIVGIVLAVAFFVFYLHIGLQLNIFGIWQVDNLFEADTGSWIRRVAAEDVRDFEMRGPHPFTYFLFRPFGFIFNLFTDNPVISSSLFNSMMGGLCVFLAWLFVKRQFQNKSYAFLIASLLGISTAHLFFGSVVDTYISSACALILFFVFLQQAETSKPALILTSVLTFGITLTNFVQNFIAFVVAKPKIKECFHFVAWVLSISLILTFAHAAVYPASKPFFLPASVQNEGKFFAEYAQIPQWRMMGRTIYLTRTMFLYSVVAPNVFILTDEVGSTIPEFRFFKISPQVFHQANYDGLGQILIMLWGVIFLSASFMFLWNLIRTKKIETSVSFVLCLIFNWLLHFIYGQELFLYAADWTYALVFFIAFGLAPFAHNRFFQGGFLVFLLLLAFNQWQFMRIILQAVAPFPMPGG